MDIYKITNIINDKIYIGKANDYKKRFKTHISSALKGSNGSPRLYNAIRKYGAENFTTERIDLSESLEDLNTKEKYWIAELHSQDPEIGYNIAPGGDGGNIIKYLTEEETMKRKLLSVLRKVIRKLKRKENNLSPEEFRQVKIENGRKAAMARKGSKLMTDGNTEKFVFPEEFNLYLDKGWRFGRVPMTDEWKAKIGAKNKGRKHSDEFKAKMSEISKNRRYSEETCKKKSESMKGKNAGKTYIHNSDGVVKLIKPEQLEEYIGLGWEKGMK